MGYDMFDVQAKCECGAIMTAKIDRQLTESELKSLEGRQCAICYLKAILQKDLQTFDSSV